MARPILALALMALMTTVLAGCSDAPPSGEFATDRHAVAVDGTVTADYQAKVRPAGENPGSDLVCNPTGSGPGECRDPYTHVSGHVMGMSTPNNDGYSLYLTSSSGMEPVMVTLLMQNTTMEGAYDIPMTSFGEDYSNDYDTFELRMGDLVIATAPAAEADNAFTVNPDLTMVTATATWSGAELNVTVSGAPEGVSFTGWLYADNPDTGLLEPQESFPVSGNGNFVYTAAMDIGDFNEFHIHVAGSKVNVAQGDI